MKPQQDDYRNGDGPGSGGASDDSGAEDDDEWALEDEEAPRRALAALNALRKSRQHYDVELLAAGGEQVPAHRALLAAASPYLLRALAAPPSPPAEAPPQGAPCAVPAYRVDAVDADSLRALVEYAYTGRLRAADAAGARRLYRAAWRLRLEPARALLAERLLRRPPPQDALEARALPDLAPAHLRRLDAYIADHFDEVCESGALAALPLLRLELLRASSADGGEEAPEAVAAAALTWLRDRNADATLAELCARSHLVFVDAAGALRDCGELPVGGGDAPELRDYRAQAKERAQARRPPPEPEPRPPPALPGLELGARSPRPDTAVLAARGAETNGGGTRVTRALVALRGELAAARISWRDVGDAAHTRVAVGGPLGGARDASSPGERRAAMAEARCALGVAVVDGRLVACGGYDRARVLRSAEAYSPRENEWRPIGDMRGPRARFSAARLGRALFVVGGSDGHSELDSLDALEEGRWRAAARRPLAAGHAGAAADEARAQLWAVGGWAGGRPLRAVHRYEPAADRWAEGPPLATGRSQCACVLWGDALWALGGCDAWHCLAGTELLPLGEEGAAWRAGPALPTARRSVGGAVWRGRLVSAGGSDGAASLRRTDWLGSSSDAAWRAGPEMRRARAALGLAVLDDVLYAVGGFDGKEFLSCVECLYEPDGEWTSLCAPPQPRAALPRPGPARADPNGPAEAQEPPSQNQNKQDEHQPQ